MVRVPTAETNPDGGSGDWLSNIGGFHFFVEDVQEGVSKEKQTPSLDVTCVVLAGTDQSQVGRKTVNSLYLTPKNYNKLAEFAIAVGLITREDWKTAKDAGTDLEFDEQQMIGRSFCAEVEWDEYNGKKRPKIGFKVWDPRDPKAAHIPKDAAGASGEDWGALV